MIISRGMTTSGSPPKPPVAGTVLGFSLHAVDLEAASGWVLQAALEAELPWLIVTLNPEIVVRAQRDGLLREALTAANLTVADGVGVVWAAGRHGLRLPGRVPGVELSLRVMERGGSKLKVFFLGGQPGVAAAAAQAAQARFGIVVAGSHHGYFDHAIDGAGVAQAIANSGAHLLLAGLGESQERFLHAHRHALGAKALMGVGGTLDVLAGVAQRTPAWTHKLGLEWAWRIASDRRRWHRLPRLMQFVGLVLRAPRGR